MNTKIESYIQDKTETLEKVLTFHLLNSIKKYYGTVDNLKKADNKIKSDIKNHTVSNKELSHFNNCFYVSPDKISKIVGKIKNEQGKQVRKTKQVLDNLIKRNNIKILPNYTLRYNSGKTFTVKTRYILDYKYLEKVWNNEEVWKNESSYYTKQEHKLIDKYILGYDKNTKHTSSKKEETKTQIDDDMEIMQLKEENEKLKLEIERIKKENEYLRSQNQENKTTTYNKQTSATFDDKTFFDNNTFKPIPTKIYTPEERELRKEKEQQKYKADMQKLNNMISDIFKKPTEKEVKSFCGTKDELDDLVDDMI